MTTFNNHLQIQEPLFSVTSHNSLQPGSSSPVPGLRLGSQQQLLFFLHPGPFLEPRGAHLRSVSAIQGSSSICIKMSNLKLETPRDDLPIIFFSFGQEPVEKPLWNRIQPKHMGHQKLLCCSLFPSSCPLLQLGWRRFFHRCGSCSLNTQLRF